MAVKSNSLQAQRDELWKPLGQWPGKQCANTHKGEDTVLADFSITNSTESYSCKTEVSVRKKMKSSRHPIASTSLYVHNLHLVLFKITL